MLAGGQLGLLLLWWRLNVLNIGPSCWFDRTKSESRLKWDSLRSYLTKWNENKMSSTWVFILFWAAFWADTTERIGVVSEWLFPSLKSVLDSYSVVISDVTSLRYMEYTRLCCIFSFLSSNPSTFPEVQAASSMLLSGGSDMDSWCRLNSFIYGLKCGRFLQLFHL